MFPNPYILDIKYDFKFDEDFSTERKNKDESLDSAPVEGSFFRLLDKQCEVEVTGSTKFNDFIKDEFDIDNTSFKIDESFGKSWVFEPKFISKSEPKIEEEKKIPKHRKNRYTKTVDYREIDFVSSEKDIETLWKSSSEDDGKLTRWGRDKDKVLFQLIHDMEKQNLLTLEGLANIDLNEAYNNEEALLLAHKFGWKTIVKNLIIRIKSLINRDFSIREMKNLKRIIKKEYKYKKLDFEKIIYDFPGKTMQRLQEVCDEIVDCKSKRNLSMLYISQKKN
jgi:hypothetical protein